MDNTILNKKEPFDLVKSLDRAIEILDILSSADGLLGITEISESIGLPKSTVSRLLSTLLYRGLVKQEKTTKKYGLGIKLFELGRGFIDELELRDVVKPILEELVKEINETGHFVIEDQGEVVYIEKVESTHSLRQYSRIGRRAPMHCTAVGKVILAHKCPEEVREIVKAKGLLKFTDKTITSLDRLETELQKVLDNGYAVDDEEIQELLRCIAAPILNYNSEVIGAISISGPTMRVKDIGSIAERVKKSAQKISELLGYKGQRVN